MTVAAPEVAASSPAGPYPNAYQLTQDEHRYLISQDFIRFVGFSDGKLHVFYKKITKPGIHHELFAHHGDASIKVRNPETGEEWCLRRRGGESVLGLVDRAARACP